MVPVIYKFCRGVCRIATTVLFDLKVYGVHHVPDEGGALMISNHESYLDPALIGVQVRRNMTFMAKSELFEVPGFGWLIRRLGAFPVRQGKGDKGAIDETIRKLQEGHLLNVFPEGARTLDGKLGPIQKGVALIVKRAKVPIVPVMIAGSYEAWPRSKAMPQSHPVGVLYGPPIDVGGMKAEEITQLIDRTFRAMRVDLEARMKRDAHLPSSPGRRLPRGQRLVE
ncbi:MAG TPA: lysophospholipid acyltransferase family protein [Tepidisphaeraceae bacterium]|jgi:1-acyl-sn-glycerol-3-phosphate acyltransferase|nr:lysophospholipid acyltransferase family protein [Tepidisphaeraceae bacterium]